MPLNRNVKSRILDEVVDNPGTSKEVLCEKFNLTAYRLKRVFGHISRELCDGKLVCDSVRGVWLVSMAGDRCQGVIWQGADHGGYRQCAAGPDFDDRCCYEHSECESAAMVAFLRLVGHLTGPRDPSAMSMSALGLARVESLAEELNLIRPKTRKDELNRVKLSQMLSVAKKMILWKQMIRDQARNEIPPEFMRRHRESSVNPFEFSLRKHFILLEITPNAAKEEVLKAWKRMARRYHPDVEGGGDEEMMKAVNRAKELIFRLRRWDQP